MKLDNKGTTLVEITAGFLMMAVIFVSFIKIIKLSSTMTTAAIDYKNNTLGFEEKYYNGYNYKVKYKNTSEYAFRNEDNGIEIMTKGNIVLTEWHKEDDGDFFTEWHRDEDGQMTSVALGDNPVTVKLNNISLMMIENIRDSGISKYKIFRYLYTRPASENP